jgi:exopolysaccharide biosynthesis polyprenyl glycosylphosphotransferase
MRLNLVADPAMLIFALHRATAAASGGWPPIGWMAVVASVWLVVGIALRHYDPSCHDRAALDDAALVTVLVMGISTLLEIASFSAPAGWAIPRVGRFVLWAWPLAIVTRLFVRKLARREAPRDEVLILGTGPMARLTGQDLHKLGRHNVVGYLRFANEGAKDEELLRRLARAQVLGSVAEIDQVLRTTPVDEVYIAGNARWHADEMQSAIRVCERLGIPFALPAYSFRLERARPVEGEAVSDGYLHYHSHVPRRGAFALKRMFDVVCSAAALWILAPLFVVVALAIKLTSRGPLFFRQVRVGLRGKRFNMLKFRSMVVNAESLKASLATLNEQTGPVFKMRRDPRVTAIGRFIRKYSIDELPQLINVLRGDMSVVGPRPPVPDELSKYEAWQRRRLSVRPGLTCIWQVSGRNQISFEDWMLLDMQYIDHWSLVRDFQLIFRTIPVVITGRGAS